MESVCRGNPTVGSNPTLSAMCRLVHCALRPPAIPAPADKPSCGRLPRANASEDALGPGGIASMRQTITAQDRELIEAARRVLRRNYRKKRHSVGAAVLCGSGKIYAGVNVESCGYGPCAEPVVIGMAISSGERVFRKIVAVGAADGFAVIPPCGNCRQLLFDYAPGIEVLLPRGKKIVKARAREILPDAYNHFE